jgi:hypothetical protein
MMGTACFLYFLLLAARLAAAAAACGNPAHARPCTVPSLTVDTCMCFYLAFPFFLGYSALHYTCLHMAVLPAYCLSVTSQRLTAATAGGADCCQWRQQRCTG